MRWVQCEPKETLLGEREGHCACALLSNSQPAEEWVVCIGGFCESELSATALIANANVLPALAWQTAASSPHLERDGATLSGFGDVAYLFGGLDADTELTNELVELRLLVSENTDVPQLSVSVVDRMSGAIPSPRSRHAAGGCKSSRNGASHLYIFGGETVSAPAANDLYALDLSSMMWQALDTSLGPLPSPRFLTTSLVFSSSQKQFVMYGGAYFDDHIDQRSLSDVWRFDTATSTWTCLSPDSKSEEHEATTRTFPRSNGHGGVLLNEESTIVFLGGKDGAEGCDAVKQICLKGEDCESVSLHVVLVACDGDGDGCEGPHYRYTPAVVSTSNGILLLAGQCRHPSPVESFLLTSSSSSS